MLEPHEDGREAPFAKCKLGGPHGIGAAVRLNPKDVRGIEPHRGQRQRIRDMRRLDQHYAALACLRQHAP